MAREPRRGQRGAADQHREHRVGLVRHRRRAAAPRRRSASSPISGRASSEHVVGDLPPRVGAADQRVAEPGERVRGWCARAATGSRPRRRGDVGDEAGDGGRRRQSPASSTTAARVPAAPPTAPGSAAPRRSSRASSTPCSHCAALSPKVVGTACWVSVRPAIGVVAVRSARRDERRDLRVELARAASATASRAQQHQRGVDDVLAGEAAVQPRAAAGVARRRAARAAARPAGRPGCRPPRRSARPRRRRASLTRPARSSRAVGGAMPAVDQRVRARPPRPRPSPRGRLRRSKWSPARSSPGQKRSVIRPPGSCEEDGLALALEPDVEDEARRSSGVATRVARRSSGT